MPVFVLAPSYPNRDGPQRPSRHGERRGGPFARGTARAQAGLATPARSDEVPKCLQVDERGVGLPAGGANQAWRR